MDENGKKFALTMISWLVELALVYLFIVFVMLTMAMPGLSPEMEARFAPKPKQK